MQTEKKPHEPFRRDAAQVLASAREQMSADDVTAAYNAERGEVIAVLNEALATEIVCVLRYKNHHLMRPGARAQSTPPELLEHPCEEQGHAERIPNETYSAIVRWLADDEPTAPHVVDDVLLAKENGGGDLANFLQGLAKGEAQPPSCG